MVKKRITFALTIGGSPKASSVALNNKSMQQFNSLLTNTINKINSAGDDFPVLSRNMNILDPSFNRFGKYQLKSFQQNFIKNPKSWPRLSESGIKIRRYKLNPNELKNDILDASKWITVDMGGEEQYVPVNLQTKKSGDLEPILTKFFNSLPKIKPSSEASVTPRNPVLLFTGFLKNSLEFEYYKRTFKGKKSITYRREFIYTVNAPYAEAHFTGGMIERPVLVITRKSLKDGRKNFKFKFIIPIQYSKYFKRLNLGEDYEVQVEMKRSKVHARNPFIFTKEDKSEFENFILMISEETGRKEFGKIGSDILKMIKGF